MSAIQEDSVRTFRSILYNTVKEFHELMLTIEENQIPHVLSSYYVKQIKYLDLEEIPTNKLCCFQ